MNNTEQRQRLRTILSGTRCLSPASIYDPLSARVAESVGYEIGMLAGSVASNTTLAVPDLLAALTLTEFAEQVRRIMRVSRLSLIVDADNGYGNALNVMRTVEELEHAGVSMITINDMVLPRRFGQPGETDELVSVEEMVAKLRAAVAARRDSTLSIVGRTEALRVEDTERTIARVKAYAATGIDAIYLAGLMVGLRNLEQIDAIHRAVKLPIALGASPSSFRREDFEKRGVRIMLQGHQTVAAAVKALKDTYTHLFRGGAVADLKSKIASGQEMAGLINSEEYKKRQNDYLH